MITVSRTRLTEALALVGKATEARVKVPILAHIRIEATGETLRLTGTDMDLEITADVPATCGTPVSFTVPAAPFAGAVQTLPKDADLTLGFDAGTARTTLRCGRARSTFASLNPEEFPALRFEDEPHAFPVPCAQVAAICEKVLPCASKEETRYYLNGVYLHDDGEHLAAVATDGHRLALLKMPRPEGAQGVAGVIVPTRTWAGLRALAQGEGEITLEVTPRGIRARGEGATLTSKVVDGRFPDYVRVIPPTPPNAWKVQADPFLEALARVGAVVSERSKAVKVGFEADRITLASVSAGQETDAADEIDAALAAGEPVSTGLNAVYLASILKAAGGTVVARLTDTSSQLRFSPEAEDGPDPKELYVLMPMRI